MTEPAVVPSQAKVTLRVEGNSLPQLFENAARALLNVFINPDEVGHVLREKVVVEAGDASLLLEGWVKALLDLAGQQKILFRANRFQEFDVERTGAGRLRAEVTGELVDPLRHNFRKIPGDWRCEQIHLINNSKTIEAQIILSASK